MKKITNYKDLSTANALAVTLPSGDMYYFSNMRAIYNMFSVQEVDHTIEHLWTTEFSIGIEYEPATGMKIKKIKIVKSQNKTYKRKEE